MKKIFTLAFIGMMALTGCKSSTEYGECVGLDDEKQQNLKYEVSTRNAVVSVIFLPGVIVPVWYLLEFVYCPTGEKQENE